MGRQRLLMYIFILGIFVFLLIYILIANLATGRDVAYTAHRQISEYSQMMQADHKTLLSMMENLRMLSKQIQSVDTKNNETQKHMLEAFNSKLDVHQHLLDYLHKKDIINITGGKKQEPVAALVNVGGGGGALCISEDDSSLQPVEESKLILSYSLFDGAGDDAAAKVESLSRFIYNVYNESRGIAPYDLFSLRIYHDRSLSKEIRSQIRRDCPRLRFCDITRVPRYGDLSAHLGTVWRFLPIGDSTVDVFCSRDLDSPLLQRGGDAVREWLSSGKLLHIMRDSKQHMLPIMGGMWCFKPAANRPEGVKLLEQILQKSDTKKRTKTSDGAVGGSLSTREDQTILASTVWRAFRSKSLQHDAYHCGVFFDSKPFPSRRTSGRFVGCVRDCGISNNSKDICPRRCRPDNHKDWTYC